MISTLSGIFCGRERSGTLVIAAGGVGYAVKVSDRDAGLIGARGLGERVDLATRQVFREDSQALYGFLSVDDRDFFDDVVKVKGVGPSMALKALSMHEAEVYRDLLRRGAGHAAFAAVPGIGTRMADRIVEALA